MLAQAVKPLVRLVDRYLPDPYIFVLILTLIIMAAAMAVEGHGPVAVIGMWGDGFRDLLAFCVIGTGSTTFAFFNLAIIAALLVVVPLINRLMLPSEADSIYVDRALLLDAAPEDGKIERPADRLETSRLVSSLVGLAGRWGTVFISVGLLISVLGNYLSWSLLAAEVLHSAASNDTMPSFLAGENRHNVPSAALWTTNIVIQAFLVVTNFAEYAFTLALKMTSAMTLIPYLLVAAYGLKIAWTRETYDVDPRGRDKDVAVGALAVAYALAMLYSGGLKFLLLSALLYAPGTVLFVMARRPHGANVFASARERWVFGAVSVAAACGLYGIVSGAISV
jgi:amino acid transporter